MRFARGVAVTLVCALAVALTGCSGDDEGSGGQGAQGSERPTTSGTALADLPSDLRDARSCGSGLTCALLPVPLDPERPGSGQLELQVAVETEESAPRGVLLTLAGGPGQAGVPIAELFAQRFGEQVMDAYRLVVLDQRGTGNTALRCPEMQEVMGFSDLTPPPAEAVTACARALGPDRESYSTEDVVADLDRLRDALGADRLTVMGTSYGTFVAEHYAIAHPDRVRALVLDSVVPHAGFDALAVDVMRASRRVLRAACKDMECDSDPVADLQAVIADGYDGVALLDVLTVMSIVQPSFQPMIAALAQARAGDLTALDAVVDGYRDGAKGPADELSQGLHASALCADLRFPWGTSAAPLAGRDAAVSRRADLFTAADLAPFDRATAVGNGFIRQCLPWPPVAPAGLPTRGDLPDVPTLLVVGGRDLSTPLEWTLREAADAPGGDVVVDPVSGHSVYGHEGVGKKAVDRFLLGPATAS